MEPGSYIPVKYLPVLVALILATVIAVGGLIVNSIVAPRRYSRAKLVAFESGNPPSGAPRDRFSIGFFLLAILFVVFDVEVIFLYPWAVAFNEIGSAGFWAMIGFIWLILIGYIYEILIGALTWHKK
ncbi:NADH-quinone oxidoreductase subunit A [Thermodesulfitimonas autotrophica]|uniref:NADH-quinone oxidoreductase subunit A n=1 Tax=Thermodesulfitimonas autotrophica TaxID=1894989 RepID=A0A3N5APN7_9THEO|nr:NADH-quinone oxidoreductase subunit A [Thermodesulfitimonas autotrophica]RPF46923.1 NADH-quinone oxidoreductase subunit A [Thermodesulfitimonas autotrophica]